MRYICFFMSTNGFQEKGSTDKYNGTLVPSPHLICLRDFSLMFSFKLRAVNICKSSINNSYILLFFFLRKQFTRVISCGFVQPEYISCRSRCSGYLLGLGLYLVMDITPHLHNTGIHKTCSVHIDL